MVLSKAKFCFHKVHACSLFDPAMQGDTSNGYIHALPLTHQPTLQYKITERKGRKLHDIKMTYSKERYIKNKPRLSSPIVQSSDCKWLLI